MMVIRPRQPAHPLLLFLVGFHAYHSRNLQDNKIGNVKDSIHHYCPAYCIGLVNKE